MSRITNEQRVLITVAPITDAGNPAAIDGAVTYASSDTGVAIIETVTATSAFVVATGLGAAQITATFDADLGSGVRNVLASGALEVVAAEATTAQIVFDIPELIPPTP